MQKTLMTCVGDGDALIQEVPKIHSRVKIDAFTMQSKHACCRTSWACRASPSQLPSCEGCLTSARKKSLVRAKRIVLANAFGAVPVFLAQNLYSQVVVPWLKLGTASA